MPAKQGDQHRSGEIVDLSMLSDSSDSDSEKKPAANSERDQKPASSQKDDMLRRFREKQVCDLQQLRLKQTEIFEQLNISMNEDTDLLLKKHQKEVQELYQAHEAKANAAKGSLQNEFLTIRKNQLKRFDKYKKDLEDPGLSFPAGTAVQTSECPSTSKKREQRETSKSPGEAPKKRANYEIETPPATIQSSYVEARPSGESRVSIVDPLPKAKLEAKAELGLYCLEGLRNILTTSHSNLLFKELAAIEKKERTNGTKPSVVPLNGGSLEVYMVGKADAFTETFCPRIKAEIAKAHPNLPLPESDEILAAIFAFLETAAANDPTSNLDDLRLGNFSLLLSSKGCKRQFPHIDIVDEQNRQFLYAVSNRCAGTSYYPKHFPKRITTIKDLAEHWKMIGTGIGSGIDMPSSLVKVLQKESGSSTCTLSTYLGACGSILSLTETQAEKDMKDVPSMASGTLLCIPGGVMHAGPGNSKGIRAVIFFTGAHHKASFDCEKEVQYSPTKLAMHSLSLLWNQEGMDVEARQFLLQILAYNYLDGIPDVRLKDAPLQIGNMGTDQLCRFVKEWTGKKLTEADKTALIAAYSLKDLRLADDEPEAMQE